jgi:sugar lactone lactonase YvrE
MRRILFVPLSLALLALLTTPVLAVPFPAQIDLPNGFAPEGIGTGRGSTFFTGSLSGAGIWRGDYRTGQGELLVEGGGPFVGMKVDASNRLWVAGGDAGSGYAFDASSGELLATFAFATAPTFVNDVVVTDDAAYFTDSFNPTIYRVDLGPSGAIGDVATLDLTGSIAFEPGQFNLNGIDATTSGSTLLTVNSFTGDIHAIDPTSGEVTTVDLGGGGLTNGDGILLVGHTLYVGRNANNELAVVSLSPDLTTGSLGEPITASNFDFPTTLARFGRSLYVVNARFATPITPETEYWLTAVRR